MYFSANNTSGQSNPTYGGGLRAGAFLKEANDTFRDAGKFKLSITAGVHEGSQIKFDAQTITVGADKNNDIILFGAGIAKQHFEISLPKNILERLRITPIEMPVTLDNGASVEVGQYAEVDSGTTIAFGDSELLVERIADPRKFKKPIIRAVAIACVLAMLPIGYNILSNAAVGIADASSSAISSLSNTVGQTGRKYLGNAVNFSGSGEADVTEAFTWTVRTQLEDLKLNHRLRAQSTPDGSIRVSGNISDQEARRWTAFLQWYDTKTNFPPLIRDVNRTDVSRDMPSIKSVWLDKKPTVFFKDGTVGNVGAILNGGWKIVSIDNLSVMIERDGAVVSLTY